MTHVKVDREALYWELRLLIKAVEGFIPDLAERWGSDSRLKDLIAEMNEAKRLVNYDSH